MTAAALPSMSERGRALMRTFRAAFAALDEHQKEHPGEVLELASSVMSHCRSAWPQALTAMPALDTAPFALVEPPVNEIERTICADGKYRLSFDEGHIALLITDEADTACGVMTPAMAEALIADVRRVLGGR